MAQYRILGISRLQAIFGAYRETYLKSILYFLFIIFGCSLIGWTFKLMQQKKGDQLPRWLRWQLSPLFISIGALIAALAILAQTELASYSLPSRFWLDANHFLIAGITLGISFVMLALSGKKKNWLLIMLAISLVSAGFMMIKLPWISLLNRISYTIFDLSLVILTIGMIFFVLSKIVAEKK